MQGKYTIFCRSFDGVFRCLFWSVFRTENCVYRRRRLTRISSRSTGIAPPTLRRVNRSASRNFNWVAQAGSSTSTIKVPASSLSGLTWLQTGSPTISAHREKTVTVVWRSPPRNDFRSRSILLEIGVGSGLIGDNGASFDSQHSVWSGRLRKSARGRDHDLTFG